MTVVWFWAVFTPMTTDSPSVRPDLTSARLAVTSPTWTGLATGCPVSVEDEDRIVAVVATQGGGRDGQHAGRVGHGDGDVGGHARADGLRRIRQDDRRGIRHDAAAGVGRRRSERGDGPVDVGAKGIDRHGRLLADGDLGDIALDDLGGDLVGGPVDDDRIAGRGVEAGDDVDRRNDAVDRRRERCEADLVEQVGPRLLGVGHARLRVVLAHPRLPPGVRALGVLEVLLRDPQLDPGAAQGSVRVVELAAKVRGVGRGEDVAGLDGVAGRDLDVGHGPGRRSRGGLVAGEVCGRPEGEAVGHGRGDGPGGGHVVGDVARRDGAGQELGRRRGIGGHAAERHEGGPDADGAEHDDGEDLELHGRLRCAGSGQGRARLAGLQ